MIIVANAATLRIRQKKKKRAVSYKLNPIPVQMVVLLNTSMTTVSPLLSTIENVNFTRSSVRAAILRD